MKAVSLVGITGRSPTGLSRPFFAEADDGNAYWVKSDNVTHDQRITEYVVSRLALECGLPIAPFSLVEIPEELARYSLTKQSEELKPGFAFGSRRVPYADELRTSHLGQIDLEDCLRCLCFDWWVRNPERRLGLVGGDPNALWDPTLESLVLIDHDGALARDFDETEFKREHVFRDSRPFLEDSFLTKFRTRFESAVYLLDKIWEDLPREWIEDAHGNSLTHWDRASIEAMLIKPDLAIDGILPG
ncbi:MAG: HipA family kinase [Verrucomicrobiota bacterium]